MAPLALLVALLLPAAPVVSLLVPMDSPAIVYSPYNWAVNASRAKTIYAGAYFRVIFSGQSCVLHTDTFQAGGWTGLHGPVYSHFYTRVDGGALQGPHVTVPGSPSFNVSLGPIFSSSPNHLLEVIVKATSETVNRWTPQDSAVIITGIELGDGATVVAPRRKPFNVLIFGDSITEGVRALGYTGSWQRNDTDRNDATRDYVHIYTPQPPFACNFQCFWRDCLRFPELS